MSSKHKNRNMRNAGLLLGVEPQELQIPFALRKQTSCRLTLTNYSDSNIAFLVLVTDWNKFAFQPNDIGVIFPRMTCEVIVTMQAQKEMPPNMNCKDKFWVQSIVVNSRVPLDNITIDMFDTHRIEEYRFGAVYVYPTPAASSPVAQISGSSSSRKSQKKESFENFRDAIKSIAVHNKSYEEKTGTRPFLEVEPLTLTFPFVMKKSTSSSLFELQREKSCYVRLINMTDKYIAYKVKNPNKKKYNVQPNKGIIMPRSRYNFITVTMQAEEEEVSADIQCADKFKIKSVVTFDGATVNDITTAMFNCWPYDVEEIKLSVVVEPERKEEKWSDWTTMWNTEGDYDSPTVDVVRERKDILPKTPDAKPTVDVVTNQSDILPKIPDAQPPSTSQDVKPESRSAGDHVPPKHYKSERSMVSLFVFVITVGLLVVMFWGSITKKLSESIEDWIFRALLFVIFSFISKKVGNKVWKIINFIILGGELTREEN